MPAMTAERIEARIALTKEKRTGKKSQEAADRRARKMHKRAQRKLASLQLTAKHHANRAATKVKED